jgi:CheY-like chemotaxis protein
MKSKDIRIRQTKKFGGQKVLLAEDNIMSAIHAQSVLKALNLDVDVVQNGLDAVERVKEKVYDILLIDIQMPVMGGLEASRIIRSLGYGMDQLPILALTGSDLALGLLHEHGIQDIIVKPFSKVDFVIKLNYHLSWSFKYALEMISVGLRGLKLPRG